jgi:hypothetical protein
LREKKLNLAQILNSEPKAYLVIAGGIDKRFQTENALVFLSFKLTIPNLF